MGKRICIVLFVYFLLFSYSNVDRYAYAEHEEDIKTIVVIHAYHLGYTWTYNQNEGICSVLAEKYPDANVYIEFLDWKRFPDEQLIEDIGKELDEKYKDIDIDLILVTDDKGLEFALTYRDVIFDDAPIVFGGIIDTTAAEIIGDEKNITGVFEKMKPEGMIELIETLQPEVNQLVVIHDLSESGVRTNQTFLSALESMNQDNKFQVVDWSEKTYHEILEDLKNLKDDSAVIFISYSVSSDGIVKKPQIFCTEFAEVSTVPMYSIDEHQFGYGITGGTFLSGVLQGKQIGELGARILAGEQADSIPFVTEATVYTGVDEINLNKYGLSKYLLDDTVVILNEKESFYAAHKGLVNSTIFVLVFLVILIIVLLWFQNRLVKSRAQVIESKNLLQQLNDELQAGEEELVAQNEELMQMKEELEYDNRHDYLTGLFNRYALEEHLGERISSITENGKIIVIYIDLDNFKFINNTYGHHLGDELLVLVSKRLDLVDPSLYVSRIGGDEFVLVKEFEDLEELDSLNGLLLRISKTIVKDFEIESRKISITASIGYSIYPDNGGNFEILLMEADMAMYHAKKDGKSALKKYVKDMNDIYQNEYILIRKVKEGLDKEAFYVQYQPIVSCDGKKVVSFEALVRWDDEELGSISPAKFIPIAESSGLILPIGELVCEQVMNFHNQLEENGLHDIKLSINVSIVQFYQESFVKSLLNMTTKCGIEPKFIQLEITESVMIEAYDYMAEKLNELKSHGFQIALDDFGTGFSSLAYLQRLPIDVIKIDKTFTDKILDFRGSTLVDATINLAKGFGLVTIAEGVETKEQVEYLMDKNCEYIQGFYYSKPLMADEAIAFAMERM